MVLQVMDDLAGKRGFKMKIPINAVAIAVVFGFTSKIAKAEYVCGENKNNSLSFSSAVLKKQPPVSMYFNSDMLELCDVKGNVAVYKKECKDKDSSIIRFDLILLEIILNEIPRQFTMKCHKNK